MTPGDGRGGGAKGGRGASAFLLTSSIVAAGLTAFALIGLYGPVGWEPGRDGGFVFFVFLAFWAITVLAGVTVGIPVLIGLRRLGVDHRLDALLIAGPIAGIFVSVGLGTLIAGPALRGSPSVVVLGAAAGLAAGALWWRLAVHSRSEHG